MKTNTNPDKKSISGKILILGVFAIAIALFFILDLGKFFTLSALKENKDVLQTYARSNFGLSALLFILIYCAQTALSLPGATIMTLAGGFLFGTWTGGLLVNIGATSGAALAFMVARYLLRDSIEKKFGKKLKSIQEGFSSNGFNYLMTLRLIPLFPFFLVNLASGLTRIRLSTYILATSIGILPGSFVYTNAGRQLGNINSLKDIASPAVLGAFVLLGLLALVPILFNKWKSARAKASQENHVITPR